MAENFFAIGQRTAEDFHWALAAENFLANSQQLTGDFPLEAERGKILAAKKYTEGRSVYGGAMCGCVLL